MDEILLEMERRWTPLVNAIFDEQALLRYSLILLNKINTWKELWVMSIINRTKMLSPLGKE